MASLDTDIRNIKGIGDARAAAFAKLGINTTDDLLEFFPRAYDDRTVKKRISELEDGESVCVAAIAATQPKTSYVRAGMELTKFQVMDDTGIMNVVFFNQKFISMQIRPGERYVFYGRVVQEKRQSGRFEMINPVFEPEISAGKVTGIIVPVYHSTAGLYQSTIRSAVEKCIESCSGQMPDSIPPEISSRYGLVPADYAYRNVHFPTDQNSLDKSRNRLIFEKFFVLSGALGIFRSRRTSCAGPVMEKYDIDEFSCKLPFRLTDSQRKSINEAFDDMSGGTPMARMLQGDVGSGKTAVAAACCWNAVKNGFQAAFMVPTEILAEQHYATLASIFSTFGIETVLLTGGLKTEEKRQALKKVSSGEAGVIIGTHALLSENVHFFNLGLAVADEQHRFGVQQRTSLAEKGKSPHVLVMSATPIPRSLALVVYGDMDVSVLYEMPPGRQKVDTFAVGEEMRGRVYSFIRKQVQEGSQVFMVCPAVEETETQSEGLRTVIEYARELSEKVFPDIKVGFVHGKMKPKEKNSVMENFASGETRILVATTVIEVGVDVPNASLIVVENADRFGLSQLHQLRGRVGRGTKKSYCILFKGAGGQKSADRLRIMCKTNDGFRIAEEDLKQRGPGDFFGSRQHGLPDMQIASFATDLNILKQAQEAAEYVLRSDPELIQSQNQNFRKSIEKMIKNSEGTIN